MRTTVRIVAKLAVAVMLIAVLMMFAEGAVDFVYTGF
jgi:hypothetical protein